MTPKITIGARMVASDGTALEPSEQGGTGVHVIWVKIGDILLDMNNITDVRWGLDGGVHKVTIDFMSGAFEVVNHLMKDSFTISPRL